MSYKKQELITLREHLSYLRLFCGVHVALLFVLFCYLSLRSEFRVVMSVTISTSKRCSVRLYLKLVIGGCMSYLRYLCLFAYSGVQHILCCVFHLFLFMLCTLYCQFL